ncbi:MAG: nicotinamide-nucleotide adenylyltransferase [Candidatus Helarchaeota archaeon]
MFKRGLFLGRFQPIHNGHIQVILALLKEVKELIIGVGSAQHSHTFNNPFTAGERVLMIRNAILENNIELSRIYIIPIIDTHDNRIWVSNVKSSVPKFDVIYTNNKLVFRLVKEFGLKVKNTPIFYRDKFRSTRIRKMILNDEDWEVLIPKSVANIIKEIDGINRIKDIGYSGLKI